MNLVLIKMVVRQSQQNFRELFTQKWFVSLFTHSHVVPNLYDLLLSMKNKEKMLIFYIVLSIRQVTASVKLQKGKRKKINAPYK